MSASVVLRKFGRPAVLIGIVLIISGCGFWMVTGAFTLTRIEVVGDLLGVTIDVKKLPTNLFLLSTEKLETRLAREYPTLLSIRVSKKYPHTLVISAIVRKAIVSLTTPMGIFLVDPDGIVVDGNSSSVGLPRLDIPVDTIAIGSRLTQPAVTASLLFLKEITPGIAIDQIAINDSTSLIAKTSTTDILFTQVADVKAIAGTLQTLLAGFRIKGTLPTRIDLRFDKPVVTF